MKDMLIMSVLAVGASAILFLIWTIGTGDINRILGA